jgi:hypothetical protein
MDEKKEGAISGQGKRQEESALVKAVYRCVTLAKRMGKSKTEREGGAGTEGVRGWDRDERERERERE